MLQPNEPAIQLALVDGSSLFREGLRALIEREADLEVVALAASLAGVEAVDSSPRVVVTELTLPDVARDQVVERLRRRFDDVAIVALTDVDDLAAVRQALSAGATGYVLKSASAAELLAGIRAVAGGGAYLQPSIGVAFASRPEDSRDPDGGGLTPKETVVLRLLALGHTNAEVAQLVGASLRTIETHRAHIHQKLGRHTRAELVRYALDTGLLRADDPGCATGAMNRPPASALARSGATGH